MKMQLYQGRPADMTGRQDKEKRVYELLDRLGIAYERVDHEAAETMEACEEIDKFLAPAVICKNLFLCNTQKTKFYLLMIRGDKKFKTKEISSQIHSARLSFAPAEKMEEYLNYISSVQCIWMQKKEKKNLCPKTRWMDLCLRWIMILG